MGSWGGVSGPSQCLGETLGTPREGTPQEGGVYRHEAVECSGQEAGEDGLQDTEGHDLQESENHDLQGAEGDGPQRIEGDGLQEAEEADLQEAEGDDLRQAEGGGMQGTQRDGLQVAEEHDLQEAEADDLQDTEEDDLQEGEGDQLQDTEEDDLQEGEGDDLHGSEEDDLQDTEGHDLQEGEEGDHQATEGDDLKETEGDDLQDSGGADLQDTEGYDLQEADRGSQGIEENDPQEVEGHDLQGAVADDLQEALSGHALGSPGRETDSLAEAGSGQVQGEEHNEGNVQGQGHGQEQVQGLGQEQGQGHEQEQGQGHGQDQGQGQGQGLGLAVPEGSIPAKVLGLGVLSWAFEDCTDAQGNLRNPWDPSSYPNSDTQGVGPNFGTQGVGPSFGTQGIGPSTPGVDPNDGLLESGVPEVGHGFLQPSRKEREAPELGAPSEHQPGGPVTVAGPGLGIDMPEEATAAPLLGAALLGGDAPELEVGIVQGGVGCSREEGGEEQEGVREAGGVEGLGPPAMHLTGGLGMSNAPEGSNGHRSFCRRCGLPSRGSGTHQPHSAVHQPHSDTHQPRSYTHQPHSDTLKGHGAFPMSLSRGVSHDARVGLADPCSDTREEGGRCSGFKDPRQLLVSKDVTTCTFHAPSSGRDEPQLLDHQDSQRPPTTVPPSSLQRPASHVRSVQTVQSHDAPSQTPSLLPCCQHQGLAQEQGLEQAEVVSDAPAGGWSLAPEAGHPSERCAVPQDEDSARGPWADMASLEHLGLLLGTATLPSPRTQGEGQEQQQVEEQGQGQGQQNRQKQGEQVHMFAQGQGQGQEQGLVALAGVGEPPYAPVKCLQSPQALQSSSVQPPFSPTLCKCAQGAHQHANHHQNRHQQDQHQHHHCQHQPQQQQQQQQHQNQKQPQQPEEQQHVPNPQRENGHQLVVPEGGRVQEELQLAEKVQAFTLAVSNICEARPWQTGDVRGRVAGYKAKVHPLVKAAGALLSTIQQRQRLRYSSAGSDVAKSAAPTDIPPTSGSIPALTGSTPHAAECATTIATPQATACAPMSAAQATACDTISATPQATERATISAPQATACAIISAPKATACDAMSAPPATSPGRMPATLLATLSCGPNCPHREPPTRVPRPEARREPASHLGEKPLCSRACGASGAPGHSTQGHGATPGAGCDFCPGIPSSVSHPSGSPEHGLDSQEPVKHTRHWCTLGEPRTLAGLAPQGPPRGFRASMGARPHSSGASRAREVTKTGPGAGAGLKGRAPLPGHASDSSLAGAGFGVPCATSVPGAGGFTSAPALTSRPAPAAAASGGDAPVAVQPMTLPQQLAPTAAASSPNPALVPAPTPAPAATPPSTSHTNPDPLTATVVSLFARGHNTLVQGNVQAQVPGAGEGGQQVEHAKGSTAVSMPPVHPNHSIPSSPPPSAAAAGTVCEDVPRPDASPGAGPKEGPSSKEGPSEPSLSWGLGLTQPRVLVSALLSKTQSHDRTPPNPDTSATALSLRRRPAPAKRPAPGVPSEPGALLATGRSVNGVLEASPVPVQGTKVPARHSPARQGPVRRSPARQNLGAAGSPKVKGSSYGVSGAPQADLGGNEPFHMRRTGTLPGEVGVRMGVSMAAGVGSRPVARVGTPKARRISRGIKRPKRASVNSLQARSAPLAEERHHPGVLAANQQPSVGHQGRDPLGTGNSASWSQPLSQPPSQPYSHPQSQAQLQLQPQSQPPPQSRPQPQSQLPQAKSDSLSQAQSHAQSQAPPLTGRQKSAEYITQVESTAQATGSRGRKHRIPQAQAPGVPGKKQRSTAQVHGLAEKPVVSLGHTQAHQAAEALTPVQVLKPSRTLSAPEGILETSLVLTGPRVRGATQAQGKEQSLKRPLDLEPPREVTTTTTTATLQKELKGPEKRRKKEKRRRVEKPQAPQVVVQPSQTVRDPQNLGTRASAFKSWQELVGRPGSHEIPEDASSPSPLTNLDTLSQTPPSERLSLKRPNSLPSRAMQWDEGSDPFRLRSPQVLLNPLGYRDSKTSTLGSRH